MTASRRYQTQFDPDAVDRARVVESLAQSIYVEFNVRNLLVWENVRKPHVRHWRDDCPSFRRTRHAQSRLIPAEEVAAGHNCGTCIRLDGADEKREAKRRLAEILAIEPPSAEILALPERT